MNNLFNNFFLGGVLLSFFNYISSLIAPLPLLLLKLFFNIGYYIIKNDENKVVEIIKLLEKTTSSTITLYEFGKVKPTGIFIGWKYFGMYYEIASEREAKRELHIFTYESIFKELIKDKFTSTGNKDDHDNTDHIINIKSNKSCMITIYERTGAFYNLYYDKRKYDMSKYLPTPSQDNIITRIKELFKQKKSASIFISGLPGSGKSMIGFLLANELNAKLVRTFNPTEPGDNMIRLIRDVDPDDENPLVLMLDEVDTMIRKITEHTIIPHKNIPIMINDKISFNRFMDDMMFYDNVILIMTSNEPKENIDAIDCSFLRKGRINETFVLN
jgi:hypothetical protein